MKSGTASFLLIILIFSAIGIGSCKTVKPANEIKPGPVLTFGNIEALGPETINVYFTLDLDNPGPRDAVVSIRDGALTVNGLSADPAVFALDFQDKVELPKGQRTSIPVLLTFRASEFDSIYHPQSDEYDLILALPMVFQYPSSAVEVAAEGNTVFPRIRKPDFKITQIKIMQAELINTRFKVHLEVNNPNPFPVDLASFTYELYGDNRFWADGVEKHVLHIPARDKAEIDIFLLMNFTNMRRNVLDQIIALTQVRYRFKGEARVDTGIPYLPHFTMKFEREGHSEVIR